MAKDQGSKSGLALYGKGTETQERNPFMPMESSYKGGAKGVVSNRGSNFAMEMHKTNVMDEELSGSKYHAETGRTTDSLEVNDEAGSGKRTSGGSH